MKIFIFGIDYIEKIMEQNICWNAKGHLVRFADVLAPPLEQDYLVWWSLHLCCWWSRSYFCHMSHRWRILGWVLSSNLQAVTYMCNGLGMHHGWKKGPLGGPWVSRREGWWNEHQEVLWTGARGCYAGVLWGNGQGAWSCSISAR